MNQVKRIQWRIVVILMAALGAESSALIDTSPVTDDATRNLQMAVNLGNHGTISLNEAPPYERSMYREPLPVAVSAVLVAIGCNGARTCCMLH